MADKPSIHFWINSEQPRREQSDIVESGSELNRG